MSSTSTIEWTDATWNPVRGCTKISPGCANCYAETFAERFRGVEGHPYEQGFDLRLVPDKLSEPLKWKKPRRIFVNSMSDLFHEDVPLRFIAKVLGVIAYCRRHTFQVLTKRAERLREVMDKLTLEDCLNQACLSPDFLPAWPPENLWLGVSIENKQHGWPRVFHLRNTPAAVRFFSVEPLMEDVTPLRLDGIHWVIVGGESGHGARPMRPEWATSIRDQCVAAGVPFLFKQWGQFAPIIGAHHYEHNWQSAMQSVGKKKAGRLLDGRTWDEYPATKVTVP